MKKVGLLFLIMFTIGSIAFGQTAFTATYTFTGTTGNVASFAYNGTAYAGITPSAIVKAGIVTSSSSGNFRGTGWSTTASVNTADYIGFTIDAVAGYKYTISTITFGVGTSGTGPGNWQWRSNSDSYVAALSNYTTLSSGLTNASGVLTGTKGTAYTGTVLDVSATFSNLTSQSGFRLYGYNAAAAGTGGLQGPITITGTYQVAAVPTIAVTGTPLSNFGSVAVGSNSSQETFSVSGSNLTANIVVTPPAGFQISTTSGSGYSSSAITLTQSGGTVASTPIYVVFHPTGVQSYSDNVTNVSSGATTQNVAVAGTGISAGTPTISVTGTIPVPDFGNVPVSTVSSSKTYSVSGSSLTSNIVLTPPVGFGISITNGSGYVYNPNTLTLSQSGGTVTSTPIYVVFAPTSATAYTGINISHTSSGATTQTVGVSGTGINSNYSDIIVYPSYNYPTNIDYKSYQATNISGGSTDLEVAKFRIRDGGSTTDGDALGTKLTAITFAVTNSSNIREIALYDAAGTTELGADQTGAATVSFSGLSLTASDGGTQDFTLRVSFNTTVTDNQYIGFTVTSATADPTGSIFAASDAGAATTSVTGNNNKIVVTADRLVFATGTPPASVNPSNNFSVGVKAVDVNQNTDLDQTASITLSNPMGSGVLSSATGLTHSLAAGVYNWSDVQYNAVTSFTIQAAGGSLTPVTSSTIAVVTTQNIKTEDFNYTAGSTLVGQGGWALTGTSTTNPILVTSPGLSYSNYAGSGNFNAVTLATSGEDVNLPFTPAVTSGSILASAMISVTSAQTTGDYFLHFGDGGTANFYGRVYVRADATSGIDFALMHSSGTPSTWTSAYSNTGFPTHLIVLQYTFNGSTLDDVVSLWIDPVLPLTPCSMPIPTLTATATVADAASISSINLRQGSATAAPGVIVDGIRVGQSCLDLPLPVELSSFNSNLNGRNIQLNWETKNEKNSDKFEIERYAVESNSWFTVGVVKAANLSNSPKQYSFMETNLQPGNFQYRLKMLDNDGTFQYSKTVEIVISLPENFELNQNYPNPFNPSTKISYSLPFDSKVTLDIYNIVGEKVGQLVNEQQSAGYYSVEFSNSKVNKNLTSGVYLYRLNAIDKTTGKDFSSIKKMVLLK